jgi:hypothetical protein
MEIDFPEFKQFRVRVFVGGCVKRGDRSSFRAIAHAHSVTRIKAEKRWFGWICVRSPKRLRSLDGSPSADMWHELAHILTPNHGHDDAWRKKMRELGQPIESHYQKQKRRFYKCNQCNRRVLERTMKRAIRNGGHMVSSSVQIADGTLWIFYSYDSRIKDKDWCKSSTWKKEA